jgi:hypothetical protein
MESDPLTPEERELWNEVAQVLGKELTAQVAIGRTATQEGIDATARILLNELWLQYELRRRPRRLGS